uniref:Amiloride-sensitive sodium channel n=1 Tax=Rhabditophanes sp. KR3021 TaxID=114890 RepID=A0AC35U509_9BILA
MDAFTNLMNRGTSVIPGIAQELAADCRCHEEYNHCVISPENGHIPEIVPDDDLEDVLNREELSPLHSYQTTTTTTTTQAPALVQALGLEELTDEIAITTQAQQNLIFAVGGKPMSEKIGMSQPMDELILKCSFNQRDCDFENDFKLHYDATYGNCYTFNHNRSRMVQANRAGANYGLRMLLFANTSEYLPTTESVGFRVTVHDKWITPFPDAFGYSAPTGFMTSFGVRMKQFIRLPHPYGKCLDSTNLDDSKQIYKGFNYSVEGCHRSCTQREVILSCGCSDPMYPTYNQSKVCSVSDPIARDCIKNTTQRLIREIADGTSKHECECHQPCIESGYEVSFSAARWPSGTSKVMECDASNDLCMEKYKKNAAMIQIFYEELNFETLTENPAYTLTSVLADLGGLTGLWIGASVVSLLEIIVLVVYLTQAWVQKKKLSFAQAHPSHFKRSPTTQSKKSIKNQSIESFSKHSVLEELDEPAPSPIQPEQQSNKSSTAYYLPPGAELPCICSYNAYGHIECMRVLCPEHGYLLRSKGICDDEMYDYDWDEEESEVGEEEAENIESGNNCEPPPGQHTKIDVIDELQEESTVTNNGAPSKSPTQKSKSSLHSEPNTDKQTPTRDVVSEDKSSSPRKLGRIFTVNSVEDMSGSSKGSTQKPGSKESPKASAHSKSNSDSKEKSLLPKKVSKSKSPQKSDKSRSSSQSSSNKDISSLATSHSSVDSKKSKGSRVSSHNSNSPLLG